MGAGAAGGGHARDNASAIPHAGFPAFQCIIVGGFFEDMSDAVVNLARNVAVYAEWASVVLLQSCVALQEHLNTLSHYIIPLKSPQRKARGKGSGGLGFERISTC